VSSQTEALSCSKSSPLREGGSEDINKSEIEARHAALPSTVLPPKVPSQESFPVVLGNEVMYEVQHARLVAAVVAHHLAPGGACLVCGAVRDLVRPMSLKCSSCPCLSHYDLVTEIFPLGFDNAR
jgi:hypothetical protein